MMMTMIMENTSKTTTTTTTTKTAGIKDTDDADDQQQQQQQQQPLDTTSILLFVFFEGTANTLKPATTQIGLFASACQAIDVSRYANVKNAIKASNASTKTKTKAKATKFKICFDGCGVTNGTMGALFAIGLDEQCTRVIHIVDDIIKLYNNNNNNVNVKIVAVGLSRGGIACCKLALQLQSYINNNNNKNKNRDREQEQQQQQTSSSSESSIIITLSMLLFDPVPGNAIVTKFPFTAIMSQNLSNCNCLKRVLALYPYEPLPSISMHAPTLVKYPPRTTSTGSSCCQIEEDVTLGCHQGALFDTKKFPNTSYDIASNLSFRRIYDYLLEEGCDLNFTSKYNHHNRIYQPTIEDCIELCRAELRRGKELDITSKRLTHDITGRNRTIIRRGGRSSSSKKASATTTTNEKEDESTITTNYQYLNKQHEQLEMKLLAKRKTNNESEGNGNGNNKNNNNNNNTYQLDFQDGIIMCGSW